MNCKCKSHKCDLRCKLHKCDLRCKVHKCDLQSHFAYTRLFFVSIMRLEQAQELAAALQASLRFGRAAVRLRLHLVGSARRGEATNTDLDFIVVPKTRQTLRAREELLGTVTSALTSALASALAVAPAIARERALPAGGRRRSLDVIWGSARVRVDLFFAQPDELPYALFHYTGSRLYNIRTRARAKARGWRLNQYGLFTESGRRVRGSAQVRSERDIAALLGVSYRAPEERQK